VANSFDLVLTFGIDYILQHNTVPLYSKALPHIKLL